MLNSLRFRLIIAHFTIYRNEIFILLFHPKACIIFTKMDAYTVKRFYILKGTDDENYAADPALSAVL